MRILSMTATFGKLENQTLTLNTGLNIIEAPNEWGKSTWCAFVCAMFYGIDTRAHSTKTALADKERYAPWSGAPMAGTMELLWNGRYITIERSSKGRNLFGLFRAYETHTGLEIPDLTAANCGQVLLGVEKSVFQRAGFIRSGDLPVTQDEALRRRLNAIVTTGSESDTADTLAQTLRELKNRCRSNRSTGLLPQAEAQRTVLEAKLAELETLQAQAQQFSLRLQQLEQRKLELKNHQTALHHVAGQNYLQKLADAKAALESASVKKDTAAQSCRTLPSAQEADNQILRLRQLRDYRDSLHMELQMLPQEPQKPHPHPAFPEHTPETALAQAQEDYETYQQNSARRPFPWYWILGIFLAIAMVIWLPGWAGTASGGVLLTLCAALLVGTLVKNRRRKGICQKLLQRYHPLPPAQWVAEAQNYGHQDREHRAALSQYSQERKEIAARAAQVQAQIADITGKRSLAQWEQYYADVQKQHQEYAYALREYRQAAELVNTLENAHQEAPAPAFPDTLHYTLEETLRLISDCEAEFRQLQRNLGNIQGRIEALGQASLLQQQLEEVSQRISRLETTYAALELAQNTLADATAQLQRRFAPQISGRAQALFSLLTQGRYRKFTLSEDFGVFAGTADESILHSVLWRSEGTADQLYLALRLAMAEALTPEAPLILDDALIRFDDRRLEEALRVLRDETEQKQVILFTCQSRENRILKTLL